jgi:hypothetical protein
MGNLKIHTYVHLSSFGEQGPGAGAGTGPSSTAAGDTTEAQNSNTSKWAPETFSVISWNLDGLDEKNLEKRTEAVAKLIET